jgi:hypothetical protein
MKKYVRGSLETVAGLIQQGIDEGYFLDYLKASFVLETLMGMYASVTRNNVYRDFSMKHELIKHTIMIYLRGICTGRGLIIINELKGMPI